MATRRATISRNHPISRFEFSMVRDATFLHCVAGTYSDSMARLSLSRPLSLFAASLTAAPHERHDRRDGLTTDGR